MPDILLYVLPIVGSIVLSYGLFQIAVESKTSNRKRLQDRLRGESTKPDKAMASILRRNSLTQNRSAFESVVGRLSFIPKLQTMLDQADVPWNATRVMLNLGGGAVVATAGLLVLRFNPLVAVGVGTAIILMPLLAVNFIRKRRTAQLTDQLPDVFELMSQALRAGHSLAGAIQVVHEQMPPPISNEFGQVYYEQNLGVKIEEALQAMANRIDSLDVRFFVTAVMIQRQTGGDLAEVLDNIGHVIRQRIELRGLVRGLTAEGRLSGWVLFALPFMVFFGSMYMNPNYATTLLEDPRGKLVLLVAAGMQLMGLAMIRWIVNIKI